MVGMPSGGKISRAIFCKAIDAPRITATMPTTTENGRRRAGETSFMNQCRGWRHSFASKSKIIKQSHAVGLGPNPHGAGLSKTIVLPFQGRFAIETHFEVVAGKIHPQRVPLAGRDRQLDPLFFRSLAVDCMINANIVFERIG